MLQLTQAKFLQLQERYYKTVVNLPPPVVTFQLFTAGGGDSFQQFIGEQSKSSVDKPIKCLYKRQISPYQRTKMGIDEDVEMVIYVPPKILIEQYGTFQLDYKKLNVVFNDGLNNEVYVVNKMVFGEPLYNSCIYVEYHLKSKTKI